MSKDWNSIAVYTDVRIVEHIPEYIVELVELQGSVRKCEEAGK